MLDVVLKFIGLLEYDARMLASRENLLLRVVPIGSKPPNSLVHNVPNLERINIVVENGLVVRAYLG